MAKTVIVFDPINPRLPSIRIRLADAAADALVATGAAVFPVIDTSLGTGVVVPPPTLIATPQQPEEAVISPAITSLRSSYVFTKQGAIVGKNAAMLARGGDGLGPYWPKIVYAPSTAFPDRHVVFYTTDHDAAVSGYPGSGTGGVYVMTCVADPGVAANWKTYADAVAAGWWNDVPSRPAAEPLYIGPFPANTPVQAETMWVNYVPEAGLWVGTFQVTAARSVRLDGTTYSNQGTIMATSPDLLNWTSANNINITAVPDDAIGDGHSGYFNWGPNPFTGLVNPATGGAWKYVGYASEGGGGNSPETQWGSDNPGATPVVNGTNPWTLLSQISPWGGRAAPNYPNASTNDSRLVTRWLDLSSFRATRQGFAGLMTGGPGTAGQGSANRSVYEVLLDSTGREMLGRPNPVLVRSGTAGDPDGSSAHAASIVNFADRRVIVYEGQGSAANPNSNGAGQNMLLIASSPKRNPANTWFDPLDPAIPTGASEIARSLKGASAVPAGFTAVTGGSPAAPTFDANGMTIVVSSGQEYYLFENDGFLPSQTPYVDLFLEGWKGLTSGERYPYIGFAREKAIRSGLLNALFVGNGEAASSSVLLSGIVAGTATNGGAWNAAGGSYEAIGYGASGATQEVKDLGLRWFPQAGRLFGLGLGRTEVRMENGLLTGLDLTQRFYAFVGFRGVGAAAQERIQRIVVRTKDNSNALVALTPSTDFIQGVAVSGTLTGAKNGSTITSNIPGIAVNSANRTYSGTPTASGTIADAFVETLAGYAGSPYATPVTIEAATTAFLYDKFKAADGEDITVSGYTPIIGSAWSKHNGSTSVPSIKSGRLCGTTVGSSPRIINGVVPPKADYKVEADFTFVGNLSTNYVGIMLRLSSSALQGYGLYWNASNAQWRLMRWTGTGTNLATLAATPTSGQTYHVEIRAVGSTISAYVDGTLIGTVTDTNYAAIGGIGIHYPNNATDAAGIQIDNVKATAL
ncbi:LamG-like jellyroll fold domain-containing protein [Sphingomonas profundi]|uniref:LamG-like jellyroll fold domain-containing protein n=1 Tax=Alterirhizorhabdus profundi TaxID=2681549 RepID=UPI0012E99031|nr:LamG-like jellyroll fold domain-containing protein [Sphingomonas profundi]